MARIQPIGRPSLRRSSSRVLALLLLIGVLAHSGSALAQPVRTVIDTLSGSMDAGALGARNYNVMLSKASAVKDMKQGTLVVSIYIGGTCPSCSFLVRLFDRNGNPLGHLRTPRLYDAFGIEVARKKPMGLQKLPFSVNLRDLRDVEIVEVGFAPLNWN